MQGAHGNAAVQAILQRQADGPGAAATPKPSGAVPTTLRMRDPLDGLRLGLEQQGRAPLWSLLAGQQLALTPPMPLPRLLPLTAPASGSEQPGQIVFGPFSSDDALRALTHVREKPHWLDEALRPRETRESIWDLWMVYENDGSGIVPNFGSGSDQFRTAALYVFATINRRGTGLSRVGVTAMEMTTPRGTLPEGAPFGPESTYETAPGPYSGVAAVDVGVTVASSGSSRTDFVLAAGIDSPDWGKFVQDIIHEKISNSPLFPWPSGTKPLLEGGLRWNRTIDELTSASFAGLSYTGRLELDAAMITGTRRTETTVGARFVIRTAKVHTGMGAIWAEFSPLGALARGFVRYNDGREAVLPGIEAGVNSSLMVNVGRIGIGVRGEAILSSDPAGQTGLEAGTHPTALEGSPLAGEGYGMPAGHHGTGQLILRIGF
jgi:hypothetical protein